MALQIRRIYDDKTENLLDQYHTQLAFYENHFDKLNQHLTRDAYAMKRDADPVMCEIILVLTQIYDQSIPIALDITDDDDTIRNPREPH